MASSPLSDHQNQYYSDHIFSPYPLHHNLPTPIASSDSSSGSGGGSSFSVASPGLYGGEVNHIPLSNFSSNLIINVNNGAWINNSLGTGSTPTTASSMVLPFEYSSSGYIVSSPTSSSFLGIPASALPDYCEGREILINSGDEYSGDGSEYSSNFWQPPPPSVYPIMTAENREIEGGNCGTAQRVEDNTTLKLASRYSADERKDRIRRYLTKRSQRNFTKTIKYACRKTLADRRVRIRGRFARNEVGDDDQTSLFNQKSTNHDHQEQLCYADNDLSFLQMIPPGEEEWLQEAFASLVYYGSALPDGQ